MSDCALLPTPREPGPRAGPSAAMQRGYEEDAVLVLQLVVQLALVQERKETSGASPQLSGREKGAWSLWERRIKSTRKMGALHINLQIFRMEARTPLPPATRSFLPRVGDLSGPTLEAKWDPGLASQPRWA